MKRLVIHNSSVIKEQIQSYFDGNDEAKFIHRLHGVMLFLEKEDESCDSIGALFGHSPRTVSNWIKRINGTGDIESLRSKKQPGRPSRLSADRKRELILIIRKSAEQPGNAGQIRWDAESLSRYIGEHYGVVMKKKACQRFLHQLGIFRKRGRPASPQSGVKKQAGSKKQAGLSGRKNQG